MKPRLIIATAALSALMFPAALASDLGEPEPIPSGGILIQYDRGTQPTDEQVRICERLGGEVARLKDGTYVCVRRST